MHGFIESYYSILHSTIYTICNLKLPYFNYRVFVEVVEVLGISLIEKVMKRKGSPQQL